MTTSNNGIFTVGSSGEFSFEYLFDGGWVQGELAVYNLDGMEQYTPGSVEYIQEAARRALSNSNDGYIVMNDRTEGAKYSSTLAWERDFNKGEYRGAKTFSMNAGDKFGFMLVQNSSVQELADNPDRYNQGGKTPLFSIAEANPDAVGNAPEQFAALDNKGTFGFEGTRAGQSDRDYNEVVFQVLGAEADAPFYGQVRNAGKNFRNSDIGKEIRQYSQQNFLNDGYFIVSDSGEVEIDLLFDGGWYEGEVGMFSLEGMDQYEAGSLEFIKEAATRAITNSTQGHVLFQDQTEGARFDGNFPWEPNFNSGTYQGKKTFRLTAGGKYGLMLVPNATLLEMATNPTLDGTYGKRPFFSMRGANASNAVQVIDHSTGTNNISVIGMEDQNVFLGGDRDYNDVMFTVKGASMYAPDYEDEKDPQFDTDYAPIAENDSDLTYKDTAISISIPELLGNDYDFDGDTISFDSFNASGTSGLVTRINDRLIYDPNGQFNGLKAGESAVDSFTYTITDSTGKTDTATVDITINGFDDGNENNVGTLDTVHLLPPLYAKQDVRDHYLVLSTNEETPFEVTIQNADGANGVTGGVNETYTISKDSPLIINLSEAPFGTGTGHNSLGVIDGEQVGKVDSAEGLILTGDQAFYANVRHQTNLQGLSLSSKGQLALGTEFRSGHLVTNTQQDWRKTHFISVMASEDNTTVSFKDLPEGATFVNGDPGQVILDQYESFVVGFDIEKNKNIDVNSLQGSLIVSDKPIAVNSGSWLSGTVGNGRDIGVDQIVPTNLVGSKYILVKGEATTNANLLERPIIIATEDNTEVFLRGESTSVATLNAGEELILDGNEYPASDALLIETSKSAYVYQMTSANNSTAPGLNLVLPVAENAGNQEILIPSIDLLGPGKLNIVARNTAEVYVNGSAVTGGVSVEGDSDFLVYQVGNLSGDVTVTSDESVIVTSTTGAGHIGAASYWSGLPTSLAFDDLATTTADTAVTINVLANDITSSGFKPVGLPEAPNNGTATVNDDNTITYTPDAGFSGTDVFVYRGINDGGKTDTAVVSVSVAQYLNEGTIGNDTLIGSSVSDRIVGFAGSDTITTGTGNDVIVYNSAGEGVDTITDFSVGSDKIDMTSILGASNPLTNGQVSFTQDGNNTILKYNNSDFAIFENTDVASMNDSSNFVF